MPVVKFVNAGKTQRLILNKFNNIQYLITNLYTLSNFRFQIIVTKMKPSKNEFILLLFPFSAQYLDSKKIFFGSY